MRQNTKILETCFLLMLIDFLEFILVAHFFIQKTVCNRCFVGKSI